MKQPLVKKNYARWLRQVTYLLIWLDPLKDAVDLTPIPCSLQNIVKLIQAEEVEHHRASGSLETGPCLEYLLQKRVLEELAEFAKVDVRRDSTDYTIASLHLVVWLDAVWHASPLFKVFLQSSNQCSCPITAWKSCSCAASKAHQLIASTD